MPTSCTAAWSSTTSRSTPPSRRCGRGWTNDSTPSGGGSQMLVPDPASSAGAAGMSQGARRMADDLRPQILTLSPSTVETWHRCRREFRSSQLLGIPASDEGPSADQGLLVHDLLRHVHRQGSCRDAAHVEDVLVAHGVSTSDVIRGYVARHARRCPAEADDARHELERARFHRRPAPMFMATGRIDAVWIRDGLLDARDYKTGRYESDRVADDARARLQAWLLAPAAARRGLRLRVSYECLAAETV